MDNAEREQCVGEVVANRVSTSLIQSDRWRDCSRATTVANTNDAEMRSSSRMKVYQLSGEVRAIQHFHLPTDGKNLLLFRFVIKLSQLKH